MPRFAVILPAAGRSRRFGDPWRKKVFIDLQGRPVWLRSAEAFLTHSDVIQTILCVAPEDLDWVREKFSAVLAFQNIEIVTGGAERADTVQAGLARVSPQAEYIAVHDAARPLVSRAEIDAVFAAAVANGAAILGTPLTSTIKRVEAGRITETVDRSGLWAAQTPQVFERKLLEEAFARRDGFVATDEAQLVERIGHAAAIVEGSPLNFKITTQDDFRIAGALLAQRPAAARGEASSPARPKRELW